MHGIEKASVFESLLTLPLPVGINPWLLIVPLFLLGGLLGGPAGEEPGWRGFALAKL
jgi:membrane protease YdiL (CAAX protease family)